MDTPGSRGDEHSFYPLGPGAGQGEPKRLSAGGGNSPGREDGDSEGAASQDAGTATVNAFDEVFERALSDHDRVLLWLFRISVESGLETEWANRDKQLSQFTGRGKPPFQNRGTTWNDQDQSL